MKTLLIIITFFTLSAFNTAPNTRDLAVGKVVQKFTEEGGVYFVYSVKNEGEKSIEGIEYRVKFKLNGKTISFDKSPRTLKPGEKIEYTTSYVDYDSKEFNYALEIKIKDDVKENNILKGSF
jgi:hypothetical protein